MVAKIKKPHHHILFADAHRNTIFPTFNAHTALQRSEDLLADVEHLALVYDAAGEAAGRGRLQGLSITDYYVVGFVTSLEWHARSRLADLLTHMPHLIEPREVKSIDAEAISQMPGVRVTLADLLGVSTKINNLGDYTRIFERVWDSLRITNPLKALLANSAKVAGGTQHLHDLFVRRHSLVHEVNITQVGSYLQRDTWTFEEAIAHGKMTVDLIKKIEAEISNSAPDDFPNKLESDGYPESPIVRLEREIQALEGRITAVVASDCAEDFARGTNAATEYLKVQDEVVESLLRDVPKRYYNPCPGIVEMLHRHKLEFLTAIARELDA